MQDASEIVVAAQGHIYVANLADNPLMPTNTDGPGATIPGNDFVDLGYTTEDGATFTASPTVEDINAWQKATPVRRLVTARSLMVAFSLEQWNQDTFALAFGGGTWSEPATGVFRYDPPADEDALSEYAMILDFADGDRKGRVVVYKFNVTEAVETTLTRGGAALLPITANALTPDDQDRSWYFVGDDSLAFGNFS
jgi:hypothetical protein